MSSKKNFSNTIHRFFRKCNKKIKFLLSDSAYTFNFSEEEKQKKRRGVPRLCVCLYFVFSCAVVSGGVVAVPLSGTVLAAGAAGFFFLGILMSLREWLRLNLLMST